MATLREKLPLTNRNDSIGQIILSGHSGGYQVISSILDHGGLSQQVREVWLFDALYARTDRFLAWFDQNAGRFIVLYTDNGGTKKETEQLIARLKQRDTRCLVEKERDATNAGLHQCLPIFLYTELEHDEVMQGHQAFRRFLETSALSAL